MTSDRVESWYKLFEDALYFGETQPQPLPCVVWKQLADFIRCYINDYRVLSPKEQKQFLNLCEVLEKREQEMNKINVENQIKIATAAGAAGFRFQIKGGSKDGIPP